MNRPAAFSSGSSGDLAWCCQMLLEWHGDPAQE
jgi:hypothetical protein